MSQVEQFTREKGFEELLPLFQKGALLAQNPGKFEEIAELDEADKEVIRREVTRKVFPWTNIARIVDQAKQTSGANLVNCTSLSSFVQLRQQCSELLLYLIYSTYRRRSRAQRLGSNRIQCRQPILPAGIWN